MNSEQEMRMSYHRYDTSFKFSQYGSSISSFHHLYMEGEEIIAINCYQMLDMII